MTKRIVLIHDDGVHQIVGAITDGRPLPVTLEGFEERGRTIPFVSLVRVTTRAAYYKAPMLPSTSNNFRTEQR